MAKTAAELVSAIEDGIYDAATAQSFSKRGRTLTKAAIRDLVAARRELLQEIQDAGTNSGSMATVGEVTQPT